MIGKVVWIVRKKSDSVRFFIWMMRFNDWMAEFYVRVLHLKRLVFVELLLYGLISFQYVSKKILTKLFILIILQ